VVAAIVIGCRLMSTRTSAAEQPPGHQPCQLTLRPIIGHGGSDLPIFWRVCPIQTDHFAKPFYIIVKNVNVAPCTAAHVNTY